MQIDFTLAKNGSKTCKIENNFLHSFYNPEAEAKRFVQNIQSSFIPLAIGVTEPGISYIAPFLKERFSNTIIFAIRYTNQFSEYDKLWDKTFSANDKNLSENIFYELGEETICATLFLSWKTSDAIFQSESEKTWSAIKSVILKSKDILFTREHFSKRWLINSINFCKHITNTCLFEKGTSPVVVTASGISLTKMIPFLKEHRKKFFLLALSSSIPVLAHNDITPDMCLSTDGGFYAKEHLHHLLTTYQNVPLALTPESACQKSILKNNLIIPLDYGDGFSSNILKHFNINFQKIERNGSVSGSAISLSRTLTSGNIFFVGLDLSTSDSFQHARPNALENKIITNRISSLEKNVTSQRFSSEALKVYKAWFSSLSEKQAQNIFRLSNNHPYKNSLNNIKDVNIDFFQKNYTKGNMPQIVLGEKYNISENKIKYFFEKNCSSDAYLNEVFPFDYLLYKRSTSEGDKKNLFEKILQKNEELIKKIWRII